MSKFAFIVHPLEIDNLYNWQPWTKIFPTSLIKKTLQYLPPLKVAKISINSKTQAEGILIACPLLPEQMLTLKEKVVINKIIAAARIGERLGAKIIGLGAYTSIIGDKGLTIAKNLKAAVTTGNSLTVAMVVESCKKAAKIKEINFSNAKIAIIGATGSIGTACSKILAESVSGLILCAPSLEKLKNLKEELSKINPNLLIQITTEAKRAIKHADIVITASSAPETLFALSDLKENAIACDVSAPSNIALKGKGDRPDVYYFKGGLVKANNVSLGVNISLPPGVIYACMAETIILALEQNFESYSLGSNLSTEKIKSITGLASKYHFCPL